ncbi:ATP-binding cassette sub-family A member 3-like [Mizuhopecten yessoensis]|uniref:ATP-binding cassette sub-family A member 3-like n=1 Tax=Mizuhopecten yessoensis TaxID=6573 RepID=UPI000B45920B|nr:ATP-binding cassette sub-family A member 3-like [Mizuhopecten yessoensis]
MGNFTKFLLLLWKNYVLQKRKKIVTILEIGIPTVFSLILIFVRLRVDGQPVPDAVTWTECTAFNNLDFRKLPTKVAYSPNNSMTHAIIQRAKKYLPYIDWDHGFQTEAEMVDFVQFVNRTGNITYVNNTRDYLGGIAFTNTFPTGAMPQDIQYKIRLDSVPRLAHSRFRLNPFKMDTSWYTQFMFPVYQRVGPREIGEKCGGSPGYVREGFTALQNAINNAVIELQGALNNGTDSNKHVELGLRRHPYPPYNDDNFVLVIQQQFPLVIMLSFVLVALNIVKDIVHEKEKKLKESMKMMGVSNWLHWSAWFTKYFLFLLVTVSIMTVFFCVKTDKGRVIGLTDPSLLFVFLLLYAIATISFCFAISVFFKKANSGAAAGGILFFISYVPYFFLEPRYNTFTWGQKIAACAVSNIAMAYGGAVIGMFEGTGTGVQWDNFTKGASVDDTFAMSHIMIMLVVDSVVYSLITLYLEAVFPGEYGVPQPWYFFITRNYWCGTSAVEDIPDDKRICIGQDPDYFESDPHGIPAGIQIRNLRKEFGKDEKRNIAVAGMSLDMYDGQITVLLGHNGAGKTTTMSMLTGFIPPTGGTANVNGYDIREDIASVRNSLGLCPQHDILFDTMTVQEHLWFFAKLKGCPSSEVTSAVDEMIESIKLENKRHVRSTKLSGGMKRKLSVGIALIAGSKIVILDEPSSGLDPDARRQIWTVLQKHRAGRTILLTTHFMDEADVLGDRIAIMADGVVKCCGSSLFLKNKYGAGYHMVIVKKPNCDVDTITKLIRTYVPVAEIESNIAAELSYILQQESSYRFSDMFREMETNKDDLGIASYGASVTTMEEVFLRVGQNNSSSVTDRLRGKPKMIHPQNGFSLDTSSSFRRDSLALDFNIKYNVHGMLTLQQFWAMFVKRALHTVRNKLVTVSQLVVPLFFTLMALIVIKTFPGPEDLPPLTLTTDRFGANTIVYRNSPGNFSDNISQFYSNQFDQSSTETVTHVNAQPGYNATSDIIEFLVDTGEKSIGLYNLHYMVAADFQQLSGSDKVKATAYFNDQSYHSPVISLAALSNAMIQYVTNNSDFSITTINHPLPRTTAEKIKQQITQGTTGFMVAFNVVFGMSFLASSFVVFIIKERATKSKHIQFVSGVGSLNFWASTFCWDVINYLMPSLCILVTFWAFDIEAFILDDHIAHILLLFLLYGWAMLPFMYLLSFLFSQPATGYVWLTMFNIIAGVATLLAVGILSIPELNLEDLSHALEWVFLVLLPNYCLAQGLSDYYANHEYLNICPNITVFCPIFPNPCCGATTGSCGPSGCIYYQNDYLSWDQGGIGRMLVFMFIQGVIYFNIILLLESGLSLRFLYLLGHRDQHTNRSGAESETTPLLIQQATGLHTRLYTDNTLVHEDTDVAAERARLANTNTDQLCWENSLVIKELTKYYGTKLAVDRISVGIPQGECFGLLGINGAGKTTTFKTLTGDEIMTSGEAYLRGYDIKSDITKVRQNLGYCPQYDALIDQLTGKETLYMFARLRGVQESLISGVVDSLLDMLLLKAHADKLVNAYSGGNKRKLSTAIALVGNPQVIFLDEPTTGMDPVARRYLWDTLSSVRDSGRTLILTSHSMEECEALCTRLAIMVNGQFKCLGSTQHLKHRFGEGYTLLAKVGYTPEGELAPVRPLMTYIEENFPGYELKDIHQGSLHYHINNRELSWADIFELMEAAKNRFNIEDYSVSQTTLEQVFINFARSQLPPQEKQEGLCHRACLCCHLLCCNKDS